MVNRGEMIVYLTKAGFPIEVARLIEWFRRVSQIRIEYFMRGLPPLSITSGRWEMDADEERGHRETIRIKGFAHIRIREYKPSWGYLQ